MALLLARVCAVALTSFSSLLNVFSELEHEAQQVAYLPFGAIALAVICRINQESVISFSSLIISTEIPKAVASLRKPLFLMRFFP